MDSRFRSSLVLVLVRRPRTVKENRGGGTSTQDKEDSLPGSSGAGLSTTETLEERIEPPLENEAVMLPGD